jgi:membrane protein YdbS with pleckstrin-like domain
MHMTDALGPGDRPDVLWQRRWWILGSGLLAITALVVAAFAIGQDWSWRVFTAGVVVGVAVAAFWLAPYWLFLARQGSGLTLARRRWAQHRLIVSGVGIVIVGVEVSLVAAMFAAPCILVAFVVVVMAFWLLSLMLVLVLVRRTRRRFAARDRT